MTAGLKPYPRMKDSGVEWLGEVPEHWEVLPNRALFDEIKDRDRPDEQMLSVTIKQGVIQQARLLQDTSKKDSSNLDRSKYKFLQPGDIAYNKMRAWQGAIGVSQHRGIVSPAYVIQRPRGGADSTYFHHLFRIPQFAKEAERWSYGITSDMWSLRPEHFKLIFSSLPPLPEQAAIVRYLNGQVKASPFSRSKSRPHPFRDPNRGQIEASPFSGSKSRPHPFRDQPGIAKGQSLRSKSRPHPFRDQRLNSLKYLVQIEASPFSGSAPQFLEIPRPNRGLTLFGISASIP